MTWQLLLATVTTVAALSIAGLLVTAIFHRRYRLFKFQRERFLAGPRHIDHTKCRCYFCELTE
jgi:hypothetical protein